MMFHGILKLIFAVGALTFSASASSAPFVMGAIGDSITMACNSKNFGDNPDLSWSTGDNERREVFSHFHRLQDMLGVEVETHNEATSGAKISILPRQARRVAKYFPQYVTVGIGANDICTWPSDHASKLLEFENVLDEVVGTLITARSDVKIVLMPVPDIYKAWQVGVNSPNCRRAWSTLQFCRKMFGDDVTTVQREEFHRQWRDTVDILAEVAERYSENVRYNFDSIYENITLEQLSTLDCFHPSVEGQNVIADLTWAAGWYQ